MNELSRDDVIAAVERKEPSRVPMHFMHYYNGATAEKYADQIQSLHDTYPDDDLAAFSDEGVGHRSADASCAARDAGDLSVELSHDGSFRSGPGSVGSRAAVDRDE